MEEGENWLLLLHSREVKGLWSLPCPCQGGASPAWRGIPQGWIIRDRFCLHLAPIAQSA